jgi:hypothetical protein
MERHLPNRCLPIYMNSRVLVFLVMLYLLSSCTTEHKLARQYVRNHKGEGVLLSPADILYKLNSGAFIDESLFPEPEQQDSVAFYSSTFVQYVSDSVFLTKFTNSLIEELFKMGYQVSLDKELDIFLSSPKPTWVISLAQLQLEEDFTSSLVYGYDDDDEEYSMQYPVYSVSLNSWLEVSPVNSAIGARQLLFLSGFIEDEKDMNVALDYYRGKFYFNDDRDNVSLEDIYSMASGSAKKIADMLFDYFMNDYIRRNIKDTENPRREMHYNRMFNSIEEGLPERFDVIK